MFKIAANPTFTHDVEIKEPVDGGFKTQKLKTTFEVIPSEEYRTLLKQDGFELQKRVVQRLHDLADEEGTPVEYNDDLRDQLLDRPYISLPILRAYNEALVGERAKN